LPEEKKNQHLLLFSCKKKRRTSTSSSSLARRKEGWFMTVIEAFYFTPLSPLSGLVSSLERAPSCIDYDTRGNMLALLL
jgi:hypothetical protein